MKGPVYKIMPLNEWAANRSMEAIPQSALDQRDGFIHLSPPNLVLETAALYFDPASQPVVIEIDPEALGEELKWEAVESRNGALFPHLYAPQIPRTAIRAVIALQFQNDGTFQMGARSPID